MSDLAASAPGKAFLCGEYAVTEGASGIVAAVDRRVRATCDGAEGDGYPLGPETVRTRELACAAFGEATGPLALDRSALFLGRDKLGLGSSAASAVAAAGVIAADTGLSLGDHGVRHRILELALQGHAEVAPHGSGADVAAATHGGVLSCKRRSDGTLHVEPVKLPRSLALRLVWTGASARTSDLLSRVRQLRQTAPTRHAQAMSALHDGTAEFREALATGRSGAIIEAARAYHEAMKALGRAADAPIVEARLDAIASAAARTGGAAKPCGAGGGDIAIAFFDDDLAAQRFTVRCAAEGFHPLDVGFSAEGVRMESR